MSAFKTLIAAGLLATVAGSASAGQENALVVLFSGNDTLSEQTADSIGCAILRSGPIMAQQGTVKVPGLTEYAVMTCDNPILADAAARRKLGGALAVFEGSLFQFPAAEDSNGLADRQYILKLGYYNNSDIDRRNTDLAALGVMAEQRDGRWISEAFLNVDDAMGMATPDEVVLLYYPSADQATGFRDANQDILEKVGAFNKAHLTGFSYLIGTATR